MTYGQYDQFFQNLIELRKKSRRYNICRAVEKQATKNLLYLSYTSFKLRMLQLDKNGFIWPKIR